MKGSMSIVGVEAKNKKSQVVSERKLRHDFMYGRRDFCFRYTLMKRTGSVVSG